MSGLRVMIYAPYSASGDVALTDALLAASIKTTYLCTGPTLADGFSPELDVEHCPVANPPAGESLLGRVVANRRRAKRDADKLEHLSRAIAKFHPTHVIAGDIELGVPTVYDAREALEAEFKLIGLSHGSDVYSVPQRSALQKAQVLEGLIHCDAVLGFTRSHILDIELLSGDALDHRDMHALGAWIDCDHFAPPALDPRQGLPRLLAMRGEREVYRNHIIKEAAAVASQTHQLSLRMRFDGVESWNLEDEWRRWPQTLAQGSELDPVIGAIPHALMPAEYASAQVVLQAVAKESLGYTTLEAAACGRALIAMDTPLAREILPPEQAPLLVPEGLANDDRVEGMAQHISLLLSDKALRESIEKANRAWAKERFSRQLALPKAAESLASWIDGVR